MGERMNHIAEIYAMKNRGKYDDLPPMPFLFAKSASNAPTLTAFTGNIYQYTFDATNDEVFGSTEITHQYKEGTDLSAHVHWATNGSELTAKAVKWEIEYTICSPNNAFGAAVVISKEATIPANTPNRSHIVTEIGVISGTGIKIGCYILWRARRIAASGTAPAADPFGLAFGVHMEMDTFGSKTIYAK
jgi:hypothetical protein